MRQYRNLSLKYKLVILEIDFHYIHIIYLMYLLLSAILLRQSRSHPYLLFCTGCPLSCQESIKVSVMRFRNSRKVSKYNAPRKIAKRWQVLYLSYFILHFVTDFVLFLTLLFYLQINTTFLS